MPLNLIYPCNYSDLIYLVFDFLFLDKLGCSLLEALFSERPFKVIWGSELLLIFSNSDVVSITESLDFISEISDSISEGSLLSKLAFLDPEDDEFLSELFKP